MINKLGTTQAGVSVDKITIGTGDLSVSLLTLGAIIQDVRLNGADHSLTLGSTDLAAYEGPLNYYGALVGPVANRIAGASAEIGGKTYHFAANENNETTLHGGPTGTHAQVWTLADHGPDHAEFQLSLADGVGGFPANRDITARYEINGNALTLTVNATTDGPTILNLANHSYWNLDGGTDTAGHTLQTDASHYLPIDHRLIPTSIAPVQGTGFDYQTTRPIGTGSDDRIDHNLCLNGGKQALRQVAVLTGASGVSMTLSTTETGLQVYDAEKGDTFEFAGFTGKPYGALSGIAMESQGWPDAPNQADFPSVGLDAGETYAQETRWEFKA